MDPQVSAAAAGTGAGGGLPSGGRDDAAAPGLPPGMTPPANAGGRVETILSR